MLQIDERSIASLIASGQRTLSAVEDAANVKHQAVRVCALNVATHGLRTLLAALQVIADSKVDDEEQGS